MGAGRRNRKVVIQRATVTQDAHGEEVPSWATYTTEWAAIYYGRGQERRQAAMERGEQSATFQVLANAKTAAVTLKDRISEGANLWDVVGIAPDMPTPGLIELTAVRAL